MSLVEPALPLLAECGGSGKVGDPFSESHSSSSFMSCGTAWVAQRWSKEARSSQIERRVRGQRFFGYSVNRTSSGCLYYMLWPMWLWSGNLHKNHSGSRFLRLRVPCHYLENCHILVFAQLFAFFFSLFTYNKEGDEKKVLSLFSLLCVTSQVAQWSRICLPMQEMQEMWLQSLGQEDPVKKEMATHSSILAWKIPRREQRDRLQSMGSQRVGHDWACTQHTLEYGCFTMLC